MLKSVFAAFVIVASIVSLGLKFNASGKAIEVAGPGILHVTPTSELSIQIDQELWLLDKDNRHQSTINLANSDKNLNIEGDYEYFSNGDLLVHSSFTKPTLLENFNAFLRNQQKDTIESETHEGLYRCTSTGENCKLFSNSFPKLGSVFRLSIDRSNDTVYLSDTSRFILYKFDSNGVILAEQDEGFEFPNQIVFYDNALFVANTNHNGITKVETNSTYFGEKIEHYTTKLDYSHIWPAQLANVESDWWVTIPTAGMENAAIQVYNADFDPIRTIVQAPDADPISIAYFNNAVWTSDSSNLSLTRYSRDGETIKSDLPAALNARLTAAQVEREHYTELSAIGHWLFIGVLGFGVLGAFLIEKKTTLDTLSGRSKDEQSIAPATAEPDSKGTVWFENRYRKILPAFFYLTTFIVVFLVFWATLGLMSEQDEGYSVSYIFLLVSIFVAYFYRSSRFIFRNRIGICGNLLLAEDFKGRVAASPIGTISTYNTRLIVNDVVVSTGTIFNNFAFFSNPSFMQTILPKLTEAREAGHREYFTNFWKNYSSMVLETTAFILMLVVLRMLFVSL